MRITNGVMVDNMMRHLQDNTEKLDKLNQKLSSGKKFQLPSEDPAGATSSMDLEGILSGDDQHLRNINQAKNWLQSSEDALANGSKLLHSGRELAVKGANHSLSKTDRQSLAKEVEELQNELINTANAKLGDRYLFSGQKTNPEAYDENGDFQGDVKKIKREIGPDVFMEVNVNGKSTFEDGIKALDDLRNSLENNDRDAVDDLISDFDEVVDTNVKTRAQVGAKVNRIELAEKRLEQEKTRNKELLSENEDVDMAKTITDLKMQENVYRSSLASGARIMQPTLVDFLQ